MQYITDEVKHLLGEKTIHNEGEYSGGDRAKLFSSFNDAGVECEVGEFLYALVRILKPGRILETGTHEGMGAMYMGLACRENDMGMLDTLEFIPQHCATSNANFVRANLKKYINNIEADVTKWLPPNGTMYGLILLDTEPQLRFAEFLKFYEYLLPGGYLFIHDLHEHMGQCPNDEHGFAWPWGELPKEMKTLVTSGKMRPFHFSTPRGLTGFYKPKESDHQWIQ